MLGKQKISPIIIIALIALILTLLGCLASPAARAQDTQAEQSVELVPKELAAFDNFGSSLAVSGNTLLAGAPGTELTSAHNGGAAYIFQRQGKSWQETARLVPDPVQVNSGFGHAVAVDGTTAVVGARYETNPGHGNGSGAVYVFVQKKDGWQLQSRLAAIDGAPFDLFGYTVALHGDWLCVGARAADGPRGERNTGAVYIFRRSADTWNLQARLAPGDLAAEDHFGQAIALDDEYLFASAPGRDAPGAPNSGLVYAYRLQQGKWTEVSMLSPDPPQPETQLGSVLGLEGRTLIALASQEYQKGKLPPSAPLYGGDFGVVHIFELRGGSWVWQTRLTPVSQEQYSLGLMGAAISTGPGGRLRLALTGLGQGIIYRYQKQGQEWEVLPAIVPEGPFSLNQGTIMALTGDQVFLTNPFRDQPGESLMSAGALYGWDW